MPVAIEPEVVAFVKRQLVARLATADARGRPSVVPVCFALVDGYFYSPIDEKRKSVSWGRLKRLRNIEENPAVSLVIDHYEADWTAFVTFSLPEWRKRCLREAVSRKSMRKSSKSSAPDTRNTRAPGSTSAPSSRSRRSA